MTAETAPRGYGITFAKENPGQPTGEQVAASLYVVATRLRAVVGRWHDPEFVTDEAAYPYIADERGAQFSGEVAPPPNATGLLRLRSDGLSERIVIAGRSGPVSLEQKVGGLVVYAARGSEDDWRGVPAADNPTRNGLVRSIRDALLRAFIVEANIGAIVGPYPRERPAYDGSTALRSSALA